MLRISCCALALIGLSGCGTMFSNEMFGKTDPLTQPRTIGEVESGYTYIPIDPFPVQTVAGDSCKDSTKSISGQLLDALPDNAVRMLVERFDLSGGVTYGVSKSSAKGESYRVTVDYINADTINVPVWIAKSMVNITTNAHEPVYLFSPPSADFVPGTEIYEVTREAPKLKGEFPRYAEFNIPVYVGVGLRVPPMPI